MGATKNSPIYSQIHLRWKFKIKALHQDPIHNQRQKRKVQMEEKETSPMLILPESDNHSSAKNVESATTGTIILTGT